MDVLLAILLVIGAAWSFWKLVRHVDPDSKLDFYWIERMQRHNEEIRAHSQRVIPPATESAQLEPEPNETPKPRTRGMEP